MHAKMMKSMKGEDEEAQLLCWGKKATGEMVADYAIGLVVDESQSIVALYHTSTHILTYG